MDDISVLLSFHNGYYAAELSFNLIKMSSTIKSRDLSVFCKTLEDELGSTFKRVAPLPGRSSADTARFEPSSIGVHHSAEHPIQQPDLASVQEVISGFVQAKVEIDNLLNEL